MAAADKSIDKLKWATRKRLQYIEIMAFYTGVVSRSDVAQAFGISDAAATKDLKLYNQLAPDNLTYQQSVFGFVPTAAFQESLADLSPATVLPIIADNLATRGGPYGDQLIYGVAVDSLPTPARYPSKQVLAQVIRAVRWQRQLAIQYRSLSDRDEDVARVIEPHALVNTGLRWHVRAYNCESFDFRDFVLSRIEAAQILDTPAESGGQYDDDWVENVTLQLAPHPGLSQRKQQNLLLDYGAQGAHISITVRRALIGYMLQKLFVDTSPDHSLDPNAYQLILLNRDEIEPFAGWAFVKGR